MTLIALAEGALQEPQLAVWLKANSKPGN